MFKWLFKKSIDKRIKDIESRIGNTSEVKELKKFVKYSKLEDEFFQKLVMFRMNPNSSKLKELKLIASKIPYLNGWPENKKVFWNYEARTWLYSIPQDVRNKIQTLLKGKAGVNLSLGSGSVPYLKDSILLDISEEMLKAAPGEKKIIFDLNKGYLPFKSKSIDNVEMIFVLDYVDAPKELLIDIKRVLKPEGRLFLAVHTNSPPKLFELHQTKIDIPILAKKAGLNVLSSKEFPLFKFYELN